MKYKFLKPRSVLIGVLLAMQSVSAIVIWISCLAVRFNGSVVGVTPEGAYKLVIDPQKLTVALLDFWWVWGAAFLSIGLAIAILVVFCIRRGNCCKPMAVMCGACSFFQCALPPVINLYSPDPDTLELVVFTEIRTLLQDLSLVLPTETVLRLVSLASFGLMSLCMIGAAAALVLMILELILLGLNRPKQNPEADHA